MEDQTAGGAMAPILASPPTAVAAATPGDGPTAGWSELTKFAVAFVGVFMIILGFGAVGVMLADDEPTSPFESCRNIGTNDDPFWICGEQP